MLKLTLTLLCWLTLSVSLFACAVFHFHTKALFVGPLLPAVSGPFDLSNYQIQEFPLRKTETQPKEPYSDSVFSIWDPTTYAGRHWFLLAGESETESDAPESNEFPPTPTRGKIVLKALPVTHSEFNENKENSTRKDSNAIPAKIKGKGKGSHIREQQ